MIARHLLLALLVAGCASAPEKGCRLCPAGTPGHELTLHLKKWGAADAGSSPQ